MLDQPGHIQPSILCAQQPVYCLWEAHQQCMSVTLSIPVRDVVNMISPPPTKILKKLQTILTSLWCGRFTDRTPNHLVKVPARRQNPLHPKAIDRPSDLHCCIPSLSHRWNCAINLELTQFVHFFLISLHLFLPILKEDLERACHSLNVQALRPFQMTYRVPSSISYSASTPYNMEP